MSRIRQVLLVLLLATVPVVSSAQSEGVAPEWDTRTSLEALTKAVKRLPPLLEQLKPQDWVAQGAPAAYVDQWKAIRNEIRFLDRTVGEFAKQPDRLSVALETYFRLQAIEEMMGSFVEGIRRYSNPAVADLLSGVMNENAGNTQNLRRYLVDLAANKEAELKIADAEAQRCRSTMIQRPPSSSAKKSQSQ